MKTTEQRFFEKVNKDGSDHPYDASAGKCWFWTAGITGNSKTVEGENNGYGSFYANGRMNLAHRFSCEMAGKEISGIARHTCDSPLCVNPDHIIDGTQADNVMDMISRGRDNKARGTDVKTCKLTPEQVLEIRKDTRRVRDIAKDYGVSKSLISVIRRNEVWKHL